jgi:hypothetical protein
VAAADEVMYLFYVNVVSCLLSFLNLKPMPVCYLMLCPYVLKNNTWNLKLTVE